MICSMTVDFNGLRQQLSSSYNRLTRILEDMRGNERFYEEEIRELTKEMEILRENIVWINCLIVEEYDALDIRLRTFNDNEDEE